MRHLRTLTLIGTALMATGIASAQYGGRDPYYDRGGYGRDPYYNGGYGGRGGYGYAGSNLIRAVQDDLNRAASYDRRGGREYDRFNNAMRHLSEFDSNLSRGRFDRGKLDRAIEDVDNIVRHNHIGGRERSMLENDLGRLRDFRARNGYGGYGGYRY